MATETEVANRALSRIGAEQITSIDDNNKRANLAKTEIEQSRLLLLRDTNWNFATRWKQYDTPSADAFEVPTYTNKFLLPADCLRVQRVYYPYNSGASVAKTDTGPEPIRRYNVYGNYLGVDYEQPLLRYTSNVQVGDWDGAALEALIWRVAVNLAVPLSRSADTRVSAERNFAQAYDVAQNIDGREGIQDRLVTDNRLTSARRRGGSVY